MIRNRLKLKNMTISPSLLNKEEYILCTLDEKGNIIGVGETLTKKDLLALYTWIRDEIKPTIVDGGKA
jgi:hypothetical protein